MVLAYNGLRHEVLQKYIQRNFMMAVMVQWTMNGWN